MKLWIKVTFFNYHERVPKEFPVDQQYYLYCENITVISKYKILRFQCISNINW